jgi:hypothetical protein
VRSAYRERNEAIDHSQRENSDDNTGARPPESRFDVPRIGDAPFGTGTADNRHSRAKETKTDSSHTAAEEEEDHTARERGRHMTPPRNRNFASTQRAEESANERSNALIALR